jgi:hypothetical protein
MNQEYFGSCKAFRENVETLGQSDLVESRSSHF